MSDQNIWRQAARAGGEKVLTYHDYRELLENKDIDAVIIATNGQWKALTTIHACQAGKDVYVEKALATSIGEGWAMVKAAKKYGRIVQISTQQHSVERYREAAQIVQSDRLGRIGEVKVWDYINHNPGIGAPPDGGTKDESESHSESERKPSESRHADFSVFFRGFDSSVKPLQSVMVTGRRDVRKRGGQVGGQPGRGWSGRARVTEYARWGSRTARTPMGDWRHSQKNDLCPSASLRQQHLTRGTSALRQTSA